MQSVAEGAPKPVYVWGAWADLPRSEIEIGLAHETRSADAMEDVFISLTSF